MKYSLIIPTVRQTGLVKNCIEYIRRTEKKLKGEYEIIVVDDGSETAVQNWLKKVFEDKEKYPEVRMFYNPENKGFAHTVNCGLREAKGEYLVLVNNDVEFIQPTLDKIGDTFRAMDKVGVIGAKLLYPPGHRVQHAGVIRLPGRNAFIHVNKHVNRNNATVCEPKFCASVTGALYAIRKDCYKKVGDWNEKYFLSCEDTEYSLRVWRNGYYVYYHAGIEAIHHEGFTRGANDVDKKKRSLSWFLKERETIPKFYKDLVKYDLNGIDNMIRGLNRQSGKRKIKTIYSPSPQQRQSLPIEKPVLKKLEIGCGEFPQPGYLHLDVRKFPHVDYVCDFGKDKLPFKDDELDEILSNHSIEHVPWRQLKHVLTEWYRVLKPGGKVFFRTPDLRFICEQYLKGEITKEHPNDEGFVKKNYADKVSPGWWAIIKLFAGQDYDGNYHYFCWDYETAKETLERYGFEGVTRQHVSPVFSPGELQVEAFKKSKDSNNYVRESTRILVKRRGALGDVILTTPIVRRLREIHGEKATINVASDSGSIYLNNYFVDEILPGNTAIAGYNQVIDLDLVYEKNPKQHVIESYVAASFPEDMRDFDKRTELFPTEADKDHVIARLTQLKLDDKLDRIVVVHAAKTWPNRTWPQAQWALAIKRMVAKGKYVIVIGSGSDFNFAGDQIYNFLKQFNIQQLSYLISLAGCFVGSDSGMIHVAGTTDTKIVGLFTSAKGEYRVPFRSGEYGHNCLILKPQLDCYGCLHEQRPPVVYVGCPANLNNKCLTQITPDMVAGATDAD